MMLRDLRKLMGKQHKYDERRSEEMTDIIAQAFERSRIEGGGGVALSATEKNMNMDIAEIYSPPRVAQMADRMNLDAGWSMDPTTTD